MNNNYEVIDNFLEVSQLKELQKLIFGLEFAWYHITDGVAYPPEELNESSSDIKNELWDWYAVHVVYATVPKSSYFDYFMNLFAKKLEIKSLNRIKVNFYPRTSEVKEHQKHQDNSFSHKGAVFSLNTCDGFTRMPNGDKVDSVENRIVLFDPSEYHNSSTTSNQKGRYNINFNYF